MGNLSRARAAQTETPAANDLASSVRRFAVVFAGLGLLAGLLASVTLRRGEPECVALLAAPDGVTADATRGDDPPGRTSGARTPLISDPVGAAATAARPGSAVIVVVDSRNAVVAHATVVVLTGSDAVTYQCDAHGRCRVSMQDARILRITAPGHATSEIEVAKRTAREQIEVELPDAVELCVTARSRDGMPVPHQEIELQITDHLGHPPTAAACVSVWTDANGRAAFAELDEVEYVVRFKRRGRWLGAASQVVRPRRGLVDRVDLQVDTVDPRECFEVEIADPRLRMRWANGSCTNFVLVVDGESRAIRIPDRGRAVIAGGVAEKRAVRLAAVQPGPPQALVPLDEWRTGVTGQNSPLVLSTH